ncbi:HNH endonuclease signature motif containing protein [soil metagenome]
MGAQHLPRKLIANATRPRLTRQETDALGERIATYAAHIDAAIHSLLTSLRTFDEGGGWATHGARTCAEWAWRLHWSAATAREHLRVATRLGTLPRIDDALRRGELSYSKVRAITRVATRANEEALLIDARYSTGNQLEQIVHKYASVLRRQRPTAREDEQRRRVSRTDLDDGMVRIDAVLHPEEAQVVWAALSRLAADKLAQKHAGEDTRLAEAALAKQARGDSTEREETLTGERDFERRIERWNGKVIAFSRADALVEMADQVVRGIRPERSPTELVVTVSADVLNGSNKDAAPIASGADGTCLSIDTVRRLACDCDVVVMRENSDGKTLDVGRKTRAIPAAIWRALLKRDQTCRFPGCCNRAYVHGHHLQPWAMGGETKLGNLLLVCSFHHRFVHEYGYTRSCCSKPQPLAPTCSDAGHGAAYLQAVTRRARCDERG